MKRLLSSSSRTGLFPLLGIHTVHFRQDGGPTGGINGRGRGKEVTHRAVFEGLFTGAQPPLNGPEGGLIETDIFQGGSFAKSMIRGLGDIPDSVLRGFIVSRHACSVFITCRQNKCKFLGVDEVESGGEAGGRWNVRLGLR